MKIRHFLYSVFILSGLNLTGQDTITLQKCISSAISKFPSVSDPEVYQSISRYKQENIKALWYPFVELNGQATWQSDVVKIDVELPFPGIRFPVSPQDQYRLSLDLRQTLYDGGLARIRMEIESIQASINAEETSMNIMKLKESVCELFFNIQILGENEKSLKAQLIRLKQNYEFANASFMNGVLMQTDLYLIEAEIIKVKQKITEVAALKQTAREALSHRTGMKIDDKVFSSGSLLSVQSGSITNRFENRVFELKKIQIAESSNLASSKRLPYAFAFTQMGYGRPGLNILNDKFDTYYIVGAGLKWQLWDWNQVKREKKILVLQNNLVENQQESFNQGLEIALLNQLTEIDNRKGKITAAEELLKLRSEITSNYSVQLEKGVIKTIDYLTVLNEEVIAMINYETEKLLHQKAISEYLLLKGEL